MHESRVITSPTEMRAADRRGEWRGSTGGHCPAYQQAKASSGNKWTSQRRLRLGWSV
jgi:uncharacterized protein YcsI (UPF0317 family)